MGFKPDPNKKGTWMVWYSKRHPITGQPIQLRRRGIPSKAEAKKAEAQLIIEVENKVQGKVVAMSVVVPPWSKLVEDYRQHIIEKGFALKTVSNIYSCLRIHTFGDWGCRSVDTLTSSEIRALVRDKEGHRSPCLQKHILRCVRRVFEYAVEVGHLRHNPTPEMKFRIGHKKKKVLTEEQIDLLLSRAKEADIQWYPHWCLALYTGMRNGELYALTWDKVSFENRQILVDTSWNKRDGWKDKNGKSGSDDDARIIQIAPRLMNLLRELKLQSPESELDFVLPRVASWDQGDQARDLRMFLAGMGIPQIRFHDLRATWAILLLRKGVEPINVMMMGGWKDIKTLQIYVRQAGVEVKGAMERLP